MELIQKGLVATLVAGGVGTVGYHTIQKGNGTTLLDHITSKKRELISEDSEWEKKDTPYKTAPQEDLISGLEPRDTTKFKLWERLKKWCTSTGSKVFTNLSDDTYQKFSIWCLKPKTLNETLKNEGLTETTNWTEKVKEFNAEGNTDSGFVKPKPPVTKGEKKPIENKDIEDTCKTEKEKPFRHEYEPPYASVKRWCFDDPNAKPKAVSKNE
ncbi:hypothetical protein HF1_14100 [Mycoplasma haemofelis str. Langford 1]|uniref:Uncharacterized protein n=2 Tax=Mycoplasma haemofelis TaxID=29501 RepID=F6FH05_MYCHI|nr:hypothetical protein [Mycoplasma haemofelis]AEG73714.1 hypothetical protein MHF_1480 [Mycoplasma haemofelis Ohio2]CBY93418.1 hypothetical protein HF1_14100 [Mycoplasma haemofelis str. Langford 1]